MRRALCPCLPARRVLHRCVRSRLLQLAHMAEGPGDHHGAADHHVVRDGALTRFVQMDPGVRRVGAVITHHKDPPLGDGHLELTLRRLVPRVQIRFVQRRAVDGHLAARVTARDGVTADSDHPLDQVLFVVRRQQTDEGQELLALLDDRRIVLGRLALVLQPAAGVLEHHHVTALRLRAEPRGELVDQHPVSDADRLLHRPGRNHERLHQEGLQHQRDHQCHTHQDRYLLGLGAAAPALDPALDLAALGTPAQGALPRTRLIRLRRRARAALSVPGPSAATHARRPVRGPPRRSPAAPAGTSDRPARRSSRPGRSPGPGGRCRRRARRDGPVSHGRRSGGPP